VLVLLGLFVVLAYGAGHGGRAPGADAAALVAAVLLAVGALGLGVVIALRRSGRLRRLAVLVGVRALGRAGGAAVGYALLLRFVLFVPITLVGVVMLLVHPRRVVGVARGASDIHGAEQGRLTTGRLILREPPLRQERGAASRKRGEP
jgi:hypothetical protein